MIVIETAGRRSDIPQGRYLLEVYAEGYSLYGVEPSGRVGGFEEVIQPGLPGVFDHLEQLHQAELEEYR